MYKPEKPENRLIRGCCLWKQLQVRKHHGVALHLALQESGPGLALCCTVFQITNIFLKIWLAMNLKTGKWYSINRAVLWTGKPIRQTPFKKLACWSLSKKGDQAHGSTSPSVALLSFSRVAAMGQSTYTTQWELTMNCWSKTDWGNLKWIRLEYWIMKRMKAN